MKTRLARVREGIQKNLRVKITAMAIVPAILIQMTVGLVAVLAYTQITTRMAITRDRELARRAAEQLAGFLSDEADRLARQGSVLYASQNFPHLPQTPPGLTPPDVSDGQNSEGGIFILDASGVVTQTRTNRQDLTGQDWSENSYFSRTVTSMQPIISDLVPEGLNGGEVLVVAVPITQEGKFRGTVLNLLTLGATTSKEEFYSRMAEQLWIGESSHLYLVDGNGRVIYHSEPGYIGQDFSDQAAVQQVRLGRQDAIQTQNAAHKNVIASYAPVPGTSWGLVIEDDWATVIGTMRGYIIVQSLLMLLGVIAPAVVVAAGMKRIISPIEKLTAAAQNVAKGDFDLALTVHTGDEIEALATQFNQMAAQLRESYANLEQRVRERTEQAQRAAEAARAANRAKSAFLANMSHELRTPLNAILGYSQLMARDPGVTAQQRDYLETIGRSGEHLLGLINDVLTLSKIEAGRAALQENAFDLHRLLEGLQEIFSMTAANKDLALIVDQVTEIPRYVHADEGKLRQVLMNLLSNAIKFTREGGVTLRIGAKNPPPGPGRDMQSPEADLWLRFEVEDTGLGIAEEEMALLFEPFVQTSTGQKSQQGTGLGLPISRQFVHLMGGQLQVESTVDRGSCFRFEIPIRLAAADEIEVQIHHPRRRVTGIEPGTPPYRLLIVEDQPTNRELLIKLLAEFGFELQCANNGQEGIALWHQWQPDLIWMDMRMPVMDGYEATRQIKARARTTGRTPVIIALTASAFEEDRTAILEAGCDDFVRKPFRENDIFDALTRHLGVHFTYETPAETGTAAPLPAGQRPGLNSGLSMETLRAVLTDLPSGWATNLYQAALELDADRMLDLLEPIRGQAPALAETLNQWIRDFEYEKIMQLTSLEDE